MWQSSWCEFAEAEMCSLVRKGSSGLFPSCLIDLVPASDGFRSFCLPGGSQMMTFPEEGSLTTKV